MMPFYILWMTPGGDRKWDGPFKTRELADEALQKNVNQDRAFIAGRMKDAED